MVRAAENVAAGNEGRVPPDRGRSGDQRQAPAIAQHAHAQAYHGGGAEGLGGHYQSDPLRRRVQIRARHERAGLRRQRRRSDCPQDPRGRRRAPTFPWSRIRRWRGRCMARWRWTRKFRRSIIARWPKSSAISCGCAAWWAGRDCCEVPRKISCAAVAQEARQCLHHSLRRCWGRRSCCWARG